MTHKRGSIENILLMVTLLVLILGIVITTNSNDFSSVNNLLTGAAIGISEPNEDLGLELINETEVLESAVALPENFLVGDTENIIEQPTEDISEETIEGTIELPSEETTEEIIELPSEEIIEEPEEITEEVIELPVDLPIEEPAEVIEQPTEEIIEEPVEPIVEKPIEEPEEQPIGNELTGGLVVDLPVENISDEIVELPVEELLLVNETVEIPINESIPEIIGINETNDNITLDVIMKQLKTIHWD